MRDDATFWDGVAERYAKSQIKDMSSYTHTLDRTRAFLGATDHVLELGCGTGSTALALAPSVARITASDFSGAMIAVGQRKALEQDVQNVDFLRADAFDSGLVPGSYDAVMGFNLLHLLADLPAQLRRAHDLLKPGGVFISKTPCLGDAGLFKGMMFRTMIFGLKLVRKAPYVDFLHVVDLERTIEEAGFDIIETGSFPANPPSRFLVARKR